MKRNSISSYARQNTILWVQLQNSTSHSIRVHKTELKKWMSVILKHAKGMIDSKPAGLLSQASQYIARAPPWGGGSYSAPSSISAKELADHWVHFHCLFLLDLLIGSEDNTNSQQETRTSRITDRTKQVSTRSQKTDEGT